MAEQPRAHLFAAAETLETSAEAFLNIDDPAGALEPLAKLVEILELIGDEAEGRQRDVSRAETLCDWASTGLSGGEGRCDPEAESLDGVREGIKRLRARWGGGARPEPDPEAGQGDRAQGEATRRKELHPPSEGVNSPRQQQQQQQSQEKSEPGNSANASTSLRPGGDAVVGSTGEEVGVRVGPVPTAGFAHRRRRQRALLLAPALVGGRGSGKASAKGQKSGAPHSDVTAASKRQHETPVSLAETRPAASGVSDTATPGLAASTGGRLPHGEGVSFAAMRAVVAATGGAAASSSSSWPLASPATALAEKAVVVDGNRPRGDPRAVGEGREGRGTALLASYRRTVREGTRSLAQGSRHQLFILRTPRSATAIYHNIEHDHLPSLLLVTLAPSAHFLKEVPRRRN